MDHFRAAAIPLPQVDIFQDVDHLQGSKTLCVRRQFAQLISVAICSTGWLDPFACMLGKVLKCECAALFAQVIDHYARRYALIEVLATVARYSAERVGKVGVLEDFASFWCTISEPGLACILKLELNAVFNPAIKSSSIMREILSDNGCDRMAFTGIADCGR